VAGAKAKRRELGEKRKVNLTIHKFKESGESLRQLRTLLKASRGWKREKWKPKLEREREHNRADKSNNSQRNPGARG